MARMLYASSEEFIEYAADRGVLVSGTDARSWLNAAQDYIDTEYSFKGTAMQDSSEFPRSGLERYADDVIPYPVKQATLYAAYMLAIGVPFLEGKLAEAQIKSETIAVNRITTEYATNYQADLVQKATRLDFVTTILGRAGLLDYDVGIINMYGVRG